MEYDLKFEEEDEMVIRCPYCGSRDITPKETKYLCIDCRKKFGRDPFFLIRGKEYTPDDLTGIEFEDGGFFDGYETVTIQRSDSSYELSVQHSLGDYEPYNREFEKREWDSLKRTLFERLFIHEWKRSYVDWSILDGEQWSLELTFSDGRHRRIYGSNAYPALWDSMKSRFERYIREAREPHHTVDHIQR